MKSKPRNALAIAIVVAAVLIAAAALYLGRQLADRWDEARVAQLVDQQLAQKGSSISTPGLNETKVIQLIEERLPVATAGPAGKGVSEARVIKLIEERLAAERGALSEKEFNQRVKRGIIAFIEKQRRAEQERPNRLARNVAPPTKDDHVYGNIDAPVTLIEYSDFECPFCKRFHRTAKRLVDESKGQVKWVYRHFPIEQLHPIKARKESVASECANELGGNDAFWKFADRLYELTPSNNRTDIDTVIPQIAREIGLDEKKFASCLTSGRHDQRIDEDHRSAVASGGNGTPWSIIVSKNGKTYPLSGAQPYAAVRQIVELALGKSNP